MNAKWQQWATEEIGRLETQLERLGERLDELDHQLANVRSEAAEADRKADALEGRVYDVELAAR